MRGLLSIVFLISFLFSVSAQTYDEWIDKSFEYIESKNWEEAEKSLIEALRAQPANPQNALLLSNLGTIQRRLGKNEDALQSYTSALMITPRSVTLLMNRAALFSEMERLDDALNDYNQVLILDNKEEDALYYRGLIRLEKNDTIASRKDFEQLLKINPKSANARIGLATLLKSRGYYTEAIDLYTQVIRVNPQQVSLYLNRGEAYFLDRRLNKADEDVAKALEFDPDDPLAYVLRAKLKLARYEREDAARDLDKAVALGFDRTIADSLLNKDREKK